MIALALTDAAESLRRTADPGAIARHADAGGEREMAHRFALMASDVCAARSAWEDALTWLDLASSSSETPEELQAADKATAALLSQAGWSSPPLRRAAKPSHVPHIGRDDLDLTRGGQWAN